MNEQDAGAFDWCNGTGGVGVLDHLKQVFPHGHPHFVPLMVKLMDLHSKKNHDYARGGSPLGNFDRVAGMLKLWPNFPYDTPAGVAFIYALKQVDAEAWSMCQGGECKVEGIAERITDQVVYGGIRLCMQQDKETP